ncbi:MAG TPA: bifunctional 4-hydroxy-2-oxoglutarate aldolase/2-dehydro-3-deoxy-phosphogluconate aldolase [Caulobacteraceae bacterium]|jgi:2-dehydro-3-deoxyphosphogluconate aldolase/(4S)-4-hydroxy-2-oxoglutarate aldolase|nr:bifunctional 4-hydroxy-2-oxoglutarate aldolase/2-dehydro-3-deoxy-phosphogluconate aldolase [Caulobacteraceae bacterium]
MPSGMIMPGAYRQAASRARLLRPAGRKGVAMLAELLCGSPVLPVVTIADAASAVPMARALLAGGLNVIEITLRTPAAAEAIARITGEVEGVIVGAGTVLTQRDMTAAEQAGAQFAVSPGFSANLSADASLPLLPGVATASEVMAALEAGHSFMKFFPAEAAGGPALLKALAGPLPQARFCPTGGITPANAGAYLRLENVVCVGGSWLTPPELIAAGHWQAVERLAREAARLPPAPKDVALAESHKS